MIKNKKLITILVFTAIVNTLGGCTENEEIKPNYNVQKEELQKNTKQNNEKIEDNIENKEEQKSDVQNKLKQEEEKGLNYKALYKSELNNLNENSIKGFRYGELIDFDMDNIPEMIMLYDMKVALYTIKNGKVEACYEKKLGSRYGQGDVSYRIGINTKDQKVSIINYDAKNSWQEELIDIVTLEKGNVEIKKLYAKAKKDNDTPIRENLVEFYIDNKPVTLDTYNSIYNSTVKEAKQIDAWGNGEAENKELFNKFISLLE